MKIRTSIGALRNTLLDLIALKAGIVLTEGELLDHLRSAYRNRLEEGEEGEEGWWAAEADQLIRIRAEELEEVFLAVMHGLGAIPDELGPQVLVIERIREQVSREGLDARETMERVLGGTAILLEILRGGNPPGFEDLASEVRRRFILNNAEPETRSWSHPIRLADLFDSEDLPEGLDEGVQFDQRFIDYLHADPDRLEAMHWRQFERLCGEYFQRAGYEIEVTPPRGDGGVDVYAHRRDPVTGPELVVVQAKRLSGENTVTIDQVKAFWTDLETKGATRGVIATTTKLERGARRFCEGRKYRMTPMERAEVVNWLTEMRSRFDERGASDN